MTTQHTESQGDTPAHTHEARTHEHDHYHVSHHHKDGMMGDWDHRTAWHTHDHNHNELMHGHDYDVDSEEQEHDREAHIHDHAAPTQSPERAQMVGAGAMSDGGGRRLG